MTSSSTRRPFEPIGPAGVSEPVGPNGSIGVTGPNRFDGSTGPVGATGFTPEKLAALKAGAKVGVQPRPKRPWDGLEPDGPIEFSRSFRLNAYDRALLAYLAGLEGGSVQKTITKLIRAAAHAEIAKREG